MAPHSSTLAWKIPWTEEPGRLQSMGSRRVGHDWTTSLSIFTFLHWRRQWQPTPVFLPGESRGWGSLVGCHLWGSHRVRHNWSNLTAAVVYNSAHSWVEFSMVEYFKMLKFILNTFQNGWTSLNLMASRFSRNPWWSSFSWIQFLVLNPLP